MNGKIEAENRMTDLTNALLMAVLPDSKVDDCADLGCHGESFHFAPQPECFEIRCSGRSEHTPQSDNTSIMALLIQTGAGVNALAEAIEATFSSSEWTEIGYGIS
jgi:hypothetical protein